MNVLYISSFLYISCATKMEMEKDWGRLEGIAEMIDEETIFCTLPVLSFSLVELGFWRLVSGLLRLITYKEKLNK